MAYTPIGNKAKSGGYVPIGNKAQPKPDLKESFPTLNRVREITTAPRTTVAPTPSSNMSKAVADKQRGVTISQGTEKISPIRQLVRAIPGDSRFEKSLERDVIDPIARVGRTLFPSAGDTMRQIVNEKPGLTNEQLQEETRKRISQGGIALNAPGSPIVSDTPIFSPDIIGMIRKVPAKLVQRFAGARTTDDAVRLAREIGVTAPSPKFLDDIVKANDEAQVQKIIDNLKTSGVVSEKELPPLPKAPTPVATKVDNVATPVRGLPEVTQSTPARIEPQIPATVVRQTPEIAASSIPPVVLKREPAVIKGSPLSQASQDMKFVPDRVVQVTDPTGSGVRMFRIPEQDFEEVKRLIDDGRTPDAPIAMNKNVGDGFVHITAKTPEQMLSRENVVDGGFITAQELRQISQTPDLPPLPKLPPEMAQRLRVQRADETISRAVFDRYKNVANKPPVVDSKVVAEAKKAPGGQTQKFFGELLTPISSRLRRINPDLEVQLRKMEFEVNQNTAQSMEAIKPLLDGSSKMAPIDRQLFSLARLNGDREVYEALAEKYGLTNQLKAAESALEDIRVRANQVGMDIAKRDNYSPRIIKNPKAYLNYWRGQDDWGDINRLIEEEAKKKNITYTDLMKDPEKVASIINNYIRGYGSKTVLAAPSATKKRTIAVLDEELAEFYEDADTALATYMIRMNDEIAGRKFFGKKADGDADIQDSIGAHVMELVAKGKIKPQQQEEVADILRSRFHRGKIAGALDLYRNAEYISTMGSPVSAITQIGDFAWSLYDNGFWNTGKAIAGKKKLTREALGLDASIMNEYTNGTLGGKAVEKTFKLVGLDKMARLGQESMVNAQFAKYQKLARENDDVIRAEMDRLFDSDEAAQAMKEFANGDITERTKFVVFNRLLDFQPLTKSEMPQVYLERPNGRIFYMLKSFTLKQYDVFRREAFDKIATGEAPQVKQGVRNLIALAGLFMMANATADEVKDLLLGRETPPSDRLIDNLWRLVGASKYDVYKAREDGIGTTVLRKILFPASIWDRASKDFETVVTDKEYEKGPLAGENYKFESTQTIPVGGKLYYWWFGRGAQKEEYKKGSQKQPEAAPLPTLPELPKLPKLPKI